MDINEAALRLKELEIIQSQITYLQNEAKNTSSWEYAGDCNDKAQELLLDFFEKD